MVRPFQPPNTSGQQGGSTILDRVLAMIADSLASLAGAVTNDVLVSASVGVADTVVTHGLGFIPKAWEIVGRDANAVVWKSPTVNARASTTIILRASARVNVTLRFS